MTELCLFCNKTLISDVFTLKTCGCQYHKACLKNPIIDFIKQGRGEQFWCPSTSFLKEVPIRCKRVLTDVVLDYAGILTSEEISGLREELQREELE